MHHMALLSVGDAAPDIEGRRRDGSVVRLSEMRDRRVLVYFYPKDDTPGCTIESCTLNDNLDDLTAVGADVIGVSTDSWDSHFRFQGKHGLRFALASDSGRTIADAYGVGRSITSFGMLQRVSFLVGPDGLIEEVWPSVSAKTHAADVLTAVQKRQAAAGPTTA